MSRAAVAFAVVVVTLPSAASAVCTGFPTCASFEHRVQPSHGESIPANAPGILVAWPPAPNRTLVIEREDGGAVGYTIDDAGSSPGLVFPSELAPGLRYTTRIISGTCDDVDGGVFQGSYVVSPSASPATDLGAVTVGPAEHAEVDVSGGAGGDACGTFPGRRFRFHVSPSPSLLPWLPLTRWFVTIDGADTNFLEWGGLLADGSVAPFAAPPFDDRSQPMAATFLCNGGPHRLQLFAEIAGQVGALGSEVFLVDASCAPTEGSAESGPLSGSRGSSVNDARGCGCGTGGLAPFALLLLALALRRPRRA